MDRHLFFENALGANNNTWLRVNSLVVNRIGIKEAIILKQLLQWQNEYARKHLLNDKGYFESNYSEICNETGFNDKQVPAATKKLQSLGLIDTYLNEEVENNTRNRFYKVNKDKYDEILKDGTNNICTNIEDDYYWVTYNKNLAKAIGPIEAIMLTDLYISFIDSKNKGELVENIWMPLPQRRLAEQLGISRQTVVNVYFPKLKKTGFIQFKTFGKDNTTHVMLDEAKLADYLGIIELLEEFKDETTVDQITKHIIVKARDYNEDWSENYYEKAAVIEARLNEGIAAKDLYDLIDFVYEWYQRPNHIQYYKTNFNFNYIFGKGRCDKQFISLKNADHVTKGLLFAIQKLSNNEHIWPLDDTKINLVRKKLDAGILPEEILNKIIYTFKNTDDCSNFTFKSLLD